MSETSDLDNFSSASTPNLNILNPGDEMNHCLSCLDKNYYCYKISRQATKFQESRRNEIFYSFYRCNPGFWTMVCHFLLSYGGFQARRGLTGPSQAKNLPLGFHFTLGLGRAIWLHY